jgi:DNA-binding CsgD family transcriptional regulator
LTLLDRRGPCFGRLSAICSFVPPIISLLLLTVVLATFGSIEIAFAQAVPLIVVFCLGLAAISQIHCFVRNVILDSQSLFLASGLGIIGAALISHLAFSLVAVNAFGTLTITILMVLTGIVVARKSMRSVGIPTESSLPIPKAPSTETLQDFREIAPIAIPIMLESLLCSISLGMSWRTDPFIQADSNRELFILVLLLGASYTFLVHHYWKRCMDVDALLVGATVPLALPILISVFDGSVAPVLLFMIAALSELLFLLLAWIGALMIGRISFRTEAVASIFIVAFLVVYGCSILLSNLLGGLALERALALIAMLFLFYVIHFFIQKSHALQSGNAFSTEIGELLRKRCEIAAIQYQLSPRETELLPLLAVGLTANEIGRRIFISPETVKTHRSRIYNKIGIHSHDELVRELNLLKT